MRQAGNPATVKPLFLRPCFRQQEKILIDSADQAGHISGITQHSILCRFYLSSFSIKRKTARRRPHLFGSGRRIRTLTYGVRVRCATFTQSR